MKRLKSMAMEPRVAAIVSNVTDGAAAVGVTVDLDAEDGGVKKHFAFGATNPSRLVLSIAYRNSVRPI